MLKKCNGDLELTITKLFGEKLLIPVPVG